MKPVKFYRSRDVRDPVLKHDVAVFDQLFPGWKTGSWIHKHDGLGFVFEFDLPGRPTIADTDVYQIIKASIDEANSRVESGGIY